MRPDYNSPLPRIWLLKWAAVVLCIRLWWCLEVGGLLTVCFRTDWSAGTHFHSSLLLFDTFLHMSSPVFSSLTLLLNYPWMTQLKQNLSLKCKNISMLMCLSLQWSSGSCYLFGLGYDCGNHLLLHLHDVWITLHQGHACSYTAGI